MLEITRKANAKMDKLKTDRKDGKEVITAKIREMSDSGLKDLDQVLEPTQGRLQDDRMHELLSGIFDEIGRIDSMVSSLNVARINGLALGSEILLAEFGVHKTNDQVNINIDALRGVVKGEVAFRKGLRHKAGDEEEPTRAVAVDADGMCIIS